MRFNNRTHSFIWMRFLHKTITMKETLFILLLIPTFLFAQFQKDCGNCSTKLIEPKQLENLEIYNLRLLKNEIYARKGYTFTNKTFAEYFKKFSWYQPKNDNNSIQFSDIESKNIALINEQINVIDQYIGSEDNSKYRTLSNDKIETLFTAQKKQELGINFPIWKVYKYEDKTGSYYLVLTEQKHKEPQDEKIFNSAIKAFNFKVEKDIWTKTFDINDAIVTDEESIWFWTKYIYVEDFDDDGIIEPIVIYGTGGMNGYDDGRIKILLYYKGKKIGIRIQNAVLDGERNFTVDADFYSIPKNIQDKIKDQMKIMIENDVTILPTDWENQMNKKALIIR